MNRVSAQKINLVFRASVCVYWEGSRVTAVGDSARRIQAALLSFVGGATPRQVMFSGIHPEGIETWTLTFDGGSAVFCRSSDLLEVEVPDELLTRLRQK